MKVSIGFASSPNGCGCPDHAGVRSLVCARPDLRGGSGRAISFTRSGAPAFTAQRRGEPAARIAITTLVSVTEPENVLVAVAWPYASGSRHLGHLAGAYLPGRHLRSPAAAGRAIEVLMVSGSRRPRHTDHGPGRGRGGVAPGHRRPLSRPRSVEQWDQLGIGVGPLHHHRHRRITRRVTQEMFLAQLDNGHIDRRVSEQFYDPEVERFLPDRYIEGDLPPLWLRRGPRRPVRQLRQDARPDRPDRSPVQDQRRHPARCVRPSTSTTAIRTSPNASAPIWTPRPAGDRTWSTSPGDGWRTRACRTGPSPATSTGASSSPSTTSARASASTSGTTP